MSNMAKADRITGGVMLLFALGVVAMARQMPMFAEFGPGAGFLPFWLGVLIGVLAILLFVNAGHYRGEHEEGSTLPTRRGAIRSAVAFAALVVYVLLLQYLGFFIPTLLVITFLMKALGHDTWKNSIVIAVAGTLALYVVFGVLLEVTLPASILNYPLNLPNGF